MQSSSHAGDESVNTVRLFDKRNKSRNSAFVIACLFEMGEDELLERVDLVLKRHQVVDSLKAVIQSKHMSDCIRSPRRGRLLTLHSDRRCLSS
jgi:hypothetical protein